MIFKVFYIVDSEVKVQEDYFYFDSMNELLDCLGRTRVIYAKEVIGWYEIKEFKERYLG